MLADADVCACVRIGEIVGGRRRALITADRSGDDLLKFDGKRKN